MTTDDFATRFLPLVLKDEFIRGKQNLAKKVVHSISNDEKFKDMQSQIRLLTDPAWRHANIHEAVYPLEFPMYLMPVTKLGFMTNAKDAGVVPPFHIMKQKGDLIDWKDVPDNATIIYVSHEWTSHHHPDENMTRFRVLTNTIANLAMGKHHSVSMDSRHVEKYGRDFVVHASEWAKILRPSATFFWIDWICMPTSSLCAQAPKGPTRDELLGNMMKARRSMISYMQRSTFMVALSTHETGHRNPLNEDESAMSSYRSHRRRGWCALEAFVESISSRSRPYPILLIESENVAPRWISPLSYASCRMNCLDFSCCVDRRHYQRGIDGGKGCEKQNVRQIMETAFDMKIDNYFDSGRYTEARYCLCQKKFAVHTLPRPWARRRHRGSQKDVDAMQVKIDKQNKERMMSYDKVFNKRRSKRKNTIVAKRSKKFAILGTLRESKKEETAEDDDDDAGSDNEEFFVPQKKGALKALKKDLRWRDRKDVGLFMFAVLLDRCSAVHKLITEPEIFLPLTRRSSMFNRLSKRFSSVMSKTSSIASSRKGSSPNSSPKKSIARPKKSLYRRFSSGIASAVGVPQGVNTSTNDPINAELPKWSKLKDFGLSASMTPIMAAMAYASPTMVFLLIRSGANVDVQCALGNDPLMHACIRSRDDNVKAWLQQNPSWDLEHVNAEGKTALQCAVSACNPSRALVERLLKAGANARHVSTSGESILTAAVKNEDSDAELIELLIVHMTAMDVVGSADSSSTQGSGGGGIDYRENVTSRKVRFRRWWDMFLYKSNIRRDRKTTRTALEHSASAMHFAAMKGDIPIIESLIEAGARSGLKNGAFMDIFQIATVVGHSEETLKRMRDLLKRHESGKGNRHRILSVRSPMAPGSSNSNKSGDGDVWL